MDILKKSAVVTRGGWSRSTHCVNEILPEPVRYLSQWLVIESEIPRRGGIGRYVSVIRGTCIIVCGC